MPRRKSAPRNREASKQATRAALIAAGLAEFDGRGLDASLDSICERAGLTRGAFYVHFADRDAFIVAVMEHLLGGFLDRLTTLISHAGVERLIALYIEAAKARAPVVAGGSGLRMQHLMDACRRSPKVGRAYRKIVLAGRDRLADGLASDQVAGRVRRYIAAPALADVMVVTAFGVAAMLELEVGIDLGGLGASLLGTLRG